MSGYIRDAGTVEWATCSKFFAGVQARWGPFQLDVAANDSNAKCDRYYTKEVDGLSQPWCANNVWCNPPYGRNVGDWVEKATLAVDLGECDRVVMLLKATTDTKWFHSFAFPRSNLIGFVQGRLKFGEKGPAPFASMLLIIDSIHAPHGVFFTISRDGEVLDLVQKEVI